MKGRIPKFNKARTFTARALIVLSVAGVGAAGSVASAQAKGGGGGSITGHKTH